MLRHCQALRPAGASRAHSCQPRERQVAPPHTTRLRPSCVHCLARSYSCKFTLLDSKGTPTKTVRVSANVAADTEGTFACTTPAWSPAGSGKYRGMFSHRHATAVYIVWSVPGLAVKQLIALVH